MSKRKKMIGKKFGRLLVLSEAEKRNSYHPRWNCVCECGKMVDVLGYHLRSGATKSCGCLSVDWSRENATKHGHHGEPTYWRWNGMRDRCNNPKNKHWKDYGGRGIKCCERWDSFENFLADMGERPKGMQLDRIDNNKGYSKENCRWVTCSQNGRNKRDSIYLTFNGETKHIKEWAERTGIPYDSIRNRIKHGWEVDRILTQPTRKRTATNS